MAGCMGQPAGVLSAIITGLGIFVGSPLCRRLSKLMPSAASIHSPCQCTWKPRSGMTALMRSTQILGTMSWKPHLQQRNGLALRASACERNQAKLAKPPLDCTVCEGGQRR